jgi:hypothetical protein
MKLRRATCRRARCDFASTTHSIERGVSLPAVLARGVLAVTLSLCVAARRAMAASAPVQGETVALRLLTVLTVALVSRLRSVLWRRTSGYERGQAFHVAVLILVLGRVATTETRLLTRREELRIARQIGLRIPRTEHRLLASAWQSCQIVIPVFRRFVAYVVDSVIAEEWSRLTELFLRRRDQAEIMLRVLETVLRRNRIARRLGVTGKLQVFLRNV